VNPFNCDRYTRSEGGAKAKKPPRDGFVPESQRLSRVTCPSSGAFVELVPTPPPRRARRPHRTDVPALRSQPEQPDPQWRSAAPRGQPRAPVAVQTSPNHPIKTLRNEQLPTGSSNSRTACWSSRSRATNGADRVRGLGDRTEHRQQEGQQMRPDVPQSSVALPPGGIAEGAVRLERRREPDRASTMPAAC
jgi:hypothetical protein